MIDLHTHVLPLVDDGSDSVQASVKMVKEAVEQGVTDIFLTPHHRDLFHPSIENINKSVLVREDKMQIKLSFRSQGDVAVNTMAEQFGGGGHKNAAGGESTQSMAETLDKLRRVLINA